MDLKIRNLKLKDNRLLVGLLKRLITEYKEDWLENAIQDTDIGDSNSPELNVEEDSKKTNGAFLVVINKLIDVFSDDITKWFASLLDMTVEEYEELDFDTDLLIIEQLKEQPKFRFFFRRAFTMFNLQNIYERWSKILKERLDIITD